MRGMHINNDQALRILGQDVDALDLRKGAAQRPVSRWQCVASGCNRRKVCSLRRGLPKRLQITDAVACG